MALWLILCIGSAAVAVAGPSLDWRAHELISSAFDNTGRVVNVASVYHYVRGLEVVGSFPSSDQVLYHGTVGHLLDHRSDGNLDLDQATFDFVAAFCGSGDPKVCIPGERLGSERVGCIWFRLARPESLQLVRQGCGLAAVFQ